MKVIACLATSLDGRIASATNLRDRIGSRADLEHLLTVRNQADAILCGGETFRQHRRVRKGNKNPKIPVQCILTQHFHLPPDSPMFTETMQATPAVPVFIFSPTPAPESIRTQYPSHVQWITTEQENPALVVMKTLAQEGIQTLMVEGGGYVMNLFLQAQAIDELYQTICPLLLGGKQDPGLVSGPGFRVAEAPRTQVLSCEWKGEELYLHLKLSYPGKTTEPA